MKNALLVPLLLCLTAPLVTMAHADDSGKGDCKERSCMPPKVICLNVFCSYHREGAPGDTPQCEAGAVFKKLVTADGDEIAENSEEAFNPRFEVACDNHTLFNGSAHRYTDYMGTRLQAEIGPFPAVLLPRGALREGHRYEPSSLELPGGQNLRGFCFIYTGQQ